MNTKSFLLGMLLSMVIGYVSYAVGYSVGYRDCQDVVIQKINSFEQQQPNFNTPRKRS